MNEDCLTGIGSLHELEELVAGSMPAEVIDLHSTVQGYLWKVLGEPDLVAGPG